MTPLGSRRILRIWSGWRPCAGPDRPIQRFQQLTATGVQTDQAGVVSFSNQFPWDLLYLDLRFGFLVRPLLTAKNRAGSVQQPRHQPAYESQHRNDQRRGESP